MKPPDSAEPSFEVELKFRVLDADGLAARLERLGARPSGVIRQEDRYFQHPTRDFRQTDEALRLRRDGEDACITYKGPKIDTTSKTRPEIEIPLALPADLPRFASLLTSLGFVESGRVAKTRRRHEIQWNGRLIEIVLDEVDGLGGFVELECQAGAEEVPAAREVLLALAAHLGLTGGERRSYLQLLEEKARSL